MAILIGTYIILYGVWTDKSNAIYAGTLIIIVGLLNR